MSYKQYKEVAPYFKSTVNPFQLCLMPDTTNKSFLMGNTGFGPSMKKCQLLVAQYIASAETWDTYCEQASSQNENGSLLLFNPSNENLSHHERNMTNGEIYIYIAAQMKFGRFIGGQFISYPFNPLDPDSPFVSEIIPDNVYKNCTIVFDGIDLTRIDEDVLMDKLIEKPFVFFRILVSIYNTYITMGIDISNTQTKLGKFYKLNNEIFCKHFKTINTLRLTK